MPLCVTKVRKTSRIQDALPIYGRTCRVTAITLQTMIKARMESHAWGRRSLNDLWKLYPEGFLPCSEEPGDHNPDFVAVLDWRQCAMNTERSCGIRNNALDRKRDEKSKRKIKGEIGK